MARETNYLHKHIVAALTTAPSYATHLPGGIHRGVAPQKVGQQRHLVMSYTEGLDVQAFGGGFLGTGMDFLVKVMDCSETEELAVAALNWVETTLLAANGSTASGAAVWMDRNRPFSLPVVEDDQIWQQVGRSFTVFVDLLP